MRKRGPRDSNRLCGSFSSFSGVADGRLAIGGRGDHQFEKPFHVPARFAELDRQPIEQFRMRRQLAADAEVAGGADQARAEHFLPEAIDGDARRQRMIGAQQPLGEAQADCCGKSAGIGGSDGGRCGHDLVAALVVFAAEQDISLRSADHALASRGRRCRGHGSASSSWPADAGWRPQVAVGVRRGPPATS